MKRTARKSFVAITASAALATVWLALATAAPGDPSKPAPGNAAGLTPDGLIDFNRDVRPIITGSCLACHGPDAADRKADLRLDTFDGATRKHDGFTAIVPGDVAASDMIKMVTHPDPDKRMPKRGDPLTEKQVAILKAWIAGGAKYAKHWSYVKPQRPDVPKVSNPNWVRTPIDAFILARLDERGLKPSPEADRAGLLRRLSLDLTGLPPTVAEVDAFVNDTSADAYENAVDRLLASPRYGEHWARKWLDLARYADSAGYADDPARTIWGYRDWVIRAINENKPFDVFTIEQMAGDLLPNATLDQRVATAFHRNTQTNNEGGTSDEEFRVAAVIDRVNTTMEVWMGTTMSCAQCHDHKYDPISQKEYFEFYAILNQTEDADRRNEAPVVSVETAEQREKKAQLRKQVAELEKRATLRTPAIMASQVKWEQSFDAPVQWTDLRPSAAKTASGNPITIANDGTLYAGEAAKTDTHTLTLAPPASRLAGVRIETLPHDALPGKGAGPRQRQLRGHPRARHAHPARREPRQRPIRPRLARRQGQDGPPRRGTGVQRQQEPRPRRQSETVEHGLQRPRPTRDRWQHRWQLRREIRHAHQNLQRPVVGGRPRRDTRDRSRRRVEPHGQQPAIAPRRRGRQRARRQS